MTTTNLPVRLSPRPVRALAHRIAASTLVQRDGALIAGCCLVLLIAVVLNVLLAGKAVTWDGIQDVRPGHVVATVDTTENVR